MSFGFGRSSGFVNAVSGRYSPGPNFGVVVGGGFFMAPQFTPKRTFGHFYAGRPATVSQKTRISELEDELKQSQDAKEQAEIEDILSEIERPNVDEVHKIEEIKRIEA